MWCEQRWQAAELRNLQVGGGSLTSVLPSASRLAFHHSFKRPYWKGLVRQVSPWLTHDAAATGFAERSGAEERETSVSDVMGLWDRSSGAAGLPEGSPYALSRAAMQALPFTTREVKDQARYTALPRNGTGAYIQNLPGIDVHPQSSTRVGEHKAVPSRLRSLDFAPQHPAAGR
jgi:hypothetical protein